MRGLHQFRLATISVALAALMLRALVPVGWMPTTGDSHAAIMPCPMMDGMRMPMPKPAGHPAKHQLPASHEGTICPFATPAQPVAVLLPRRVLSASRILVFARLQPLESLRNWDHAPRAPPAAA